MTRSAFAPDDGPLLEQAASWFDRMSSGEASERERRQFEAWWNANPAHSAAYREIEAAHAASKNIADTNEMLALRHETLSRLVIPSPSRRRPALAAGIAVALISTAGLTFLNWKGENSPDAQTVSSEAGIYQTEVGERLSVTLADGSNMVLNTASRVRVAFTASERRLVLERGQALFEVAKGQKRPFVVWAGDRLIQARGTAFDVRLDGPRAVKIAMIEGLVTVTRRSAPAQHATPLRPSEVMIAAGDKMMVSRLPEVEQVTSWRDGLVIFDNDTLGEAVAEMNRYVSQPIVIGDAGLQKLRISGAFRTGETAAFLEALELSFPLKVVERGGEKRIVSRT